MKEAKPFEIVELNFYVHFDPMYCMHNHGAALVGPLDKPHKVSLLEPVSVKALSKVHTSYYCVDARDPEWEASFAQYTIAVNGDYWKELEKQIVKQRINELNKRYNINLVEADLPHTVQHCWHIVTAAAR